jgi:hypothetical protein
MNTLRGSNQKVSARAVVQPRAFDHIGRRPALQM